MIATNKDFVVAEQQGHRGYTPHVFTDKDQFIAWRQRHRLLTIVDPSCARGRMLDAQDHRFEFDLR